MHYRGNRVSPENLPLEINLVKCIRLDENVVELQIIFNQCINPRSFRHNSIIINGSPLPKSVRFTFNRRGDTIKVILFQRQNSFKLKISDVESFDGKTIEEAERLILVEKRPREI